MGIREIRKRMRTFIVTGGSQGIGRGITRSLAKNGCNIVFTFNSNEDAAKENKTFIEDNYNVKCFYIKADFISSNELSVENIFKVIKDNFADNYTGFVHNAGGYRHSREERPSVKMAKLYSDWYCNTFLLLMEYSIKEWKNSNSEIKSAVAISSPGCNISCPPYVHYLQPGIGKASMEYLVRTYAKELRSEGITVNTVIPGYVRTKAWDPILASNEAQQMTEEKMKNTTAGGWIPTEEIGNVVNFLTSKQATSITGQHFNVDRGLHLQ